MICSNCNCDLSEDLPLKEDPVFYPFWDYKEEISEEELMKVYDELEEQ